MARGYGTTWRACWPWPLAVRLQRRLPHLWPSATLSSWVPELCPRNRVITLLILFLGPDGQVFVLAYLWPVMMGA